MNLVKWNPWREMDRFSDSMSHFFDGSLIPSIGFNETSTLGNWKPAADIYEEEDKIVIKAEMPGVNKEDVHVELKDNVLTLSGERSSDKEVKEDKFYRRERVHGKFSRSFLMPDGLDAEKVKADYKDGILNIEISKPEEKKVKKIDVH